MGRSGITKIDLRLDSHIYLQKKKKKRGFVQFILELPYLHYKYEYLI